MALNAFLPQGLSYLIVGSSTGTAAFCLGSTTYSTAGNSNIQGMSVCNTSTAPVYLAFGTSAVLAAPPSTAAVSRSLCVPNSGALNLSVPPNCWISAATSAGSAGTCVITPGIGT